MKTNRSLLFTIFLGCFVINSVLASDRIIIRYKPSNLQQKQYNTGNLSMEQLNFQRMQPLSSTQISNIASEAGMSANEVNRVGDGAHVLQLGHNLSDDEMKSLIAKLKANPKVDYVDVDRILKPTSTVVANPVQWDMMKSSTVSGYGDAIGDNFTGVWDYWDNLYPNLSPGNGVVVAVIDTGYTPHPKILNGLVPSSGKCSSNNGLGQCYGYQFISDCRVAGSCPSSTPSNNASIAPSPDGLDLGDFITNQENNSGVFAGCVAGASSWHGTHVTGTIVGSGFDGSDGVLGGAYGAKVLPLRVLGKCGGYTSDIANAILYAVNQYPGLSNPNKASIINMSLGGAYSCNTDPTLQGAINTAVANGAIVVVAAGNSADNISNFTPAGCNNVVSVAAKGMDNQLSWYSNYGNTTITASGGNDGNPLGTALDQIYSTVWSSTNAFNFSDGGSYVYYEGTSMAAPHVSAALADIIALFKAKSQSYTNSQLMSILQNSASFNYYNGSSSNVYGSVSTGMLDAGNALTYANSVYNLMLNANKTLLTVYADTSADVTFTNNQAQAVNIESTQLVFAPNLSIVSDSCAGMSLNPGQSCVVTVGSITDNSATNLNVASQGTLQVVGANGVVLSSVPLTYSPVSAPVVVPSGAGGGGGGGGCSAVENGNDSGLLLILFGLAVVYVRRRMRGGYSVLKK